MNTAPLNRVLMIVLAAASLMIFAGDAAAQRRSGAPARAARPAHEEKIDLTAMYGHMWGGNVGSYLGTFRLGTAPSMFFALDYPLAPANWVELSYGHQGGALNLDQSLNGTTTLADLSINYWQLGMIRGVPVGKGNIIPYVSASAGITYFSPSVDRTEIDGETYALNSTTKFSMTLGVGVKAFFGKSERFGLRASFKTIPSFYGSSGGIWFGTGGASVGVTGYGIWQWEVAGGVTIRVG